MKFVTVITNDDASFTVGPNVIKFSNLLNDMISILAVNSNNEDDHDPIHLEHINKMQMEKVIEWCNHYECATPMDTNELQRVNYLHQLPLWDRQLFRLGNETLRSLVRAVSFLDIKPMMNMICKIISLQMKGCTVNDILKMFNIFERLPNMKRDQIADGIAADYFRSIRNTIVEISIPYIPYGEEFTENESTAMNDSTKNESTVVNESTENESTENESTENVLKNFAELSLDP